MKKLISLALVTLFVLCGCGKQQNTQDADSVISEQVITEDKKLGEYASTFIEKYIAGEKFYIQETSLSSEGERETIELAADGDKVAKRTGSTTQIVDGDMMYLVMHDQKAVLTSPAADAMAKNIILSLGIRSAKTAQANLLSTGKEDVEGTEYSFEEYKNGERTIKYYFDSKTLRYIKHIAEDGSEELYKIDVIASDIPTDFFIVPEDYVSQDLSSIMAE